VQNPANALARILASLRDANGRVTVPGFYDEVRELTPADLEAFAAVPFDEARAAAAIGVPELFGEPGFAPLARRGARPTLDICGIWSGFQGEGSKTIIPAHAHAKVSARVVPEQDPDVIFERLRAAILAVEVPGVRVDVTLHDTMRPFVVGIDHPAAAAAARCLADVFGAEPHYIREGGSIGAVASFDAVIGAPAVLLGFTNPDERAHAPNESLVLANYEGGIRTVARYWETLASA
jgi:acetylornithine deacetylase/succinyl-diaminopimelate desuccinylase-like protein